MTTVKFDRSVKYRGVRYAAHEAFKVEDEDVAQLRESGATVLSAEPNTPPQPERQSSGEEGDELKDSGDVAQLKEKLLSYTIPELTQFAEDEGIDLNGKTRKADIYNIIVASL